MFQWGLKLHVLHPSLSDYVLALTQTRKSADSLNSNDGSTS